MPDMVEIFTLLAALCSRKHLFYLYELCCLCLTESGSSLPHVKFGPIDTSDYKCAFVSSIDPVQSYLSQVPDGVSVCTPESASSDFLNLLDRTTGVDFDSVYDPWTDFNLFDRKKLFKVLEGSYKNLEGVVAATGTASVVSSATASRVFVPLAGKSRKVTLSGFTIPKKSAKSAASSSGVGVSKESAPVGTSSEKLDQSGGSSKNSSRRSSVSDTGSGSNVANS